jgi:hypothetical protein
VEYNWTHCVLQILFDSFTLEQKCTSSNTGAADADCGVPVVVAGGALVDVACDMRIIQRAEI